MTDRSDLLVFLVRFVLQRHLTIENPCSNVWSKRWMIGPQRSLQSNTNTIDFQRFDIHSQIVKLRRPLLVSFWYICRITSSVLSMSSLFRRFEQRVNRTKVVLSHHVEDFFAVTVFIWSFGHAPLSYAPRYVPIQLVVEIPSHHNTVCFAYRLYQILQLDNCVLRHRLLRSSFMRYVYDDEKYVVDRVCYFHPHNSCPHVSFTHHFVRQEYRRHDGDPCRWIRLPCSFVSATALHIQRPPWYWCVV